MILENGQANLNCIWPTTSSWSSNCQGHKPFTTWASLCHTALQITDLAHDLIQNSHKCIFLGTRETRIKHVCINPNATPILKEWFNVCALSLMASSTNTFSLLNKKLLTSSYVPCALLDTGDAQQTRDYSSPHGIFIIIDPTPNIDN